MDEINNLAESQLHDAHYLKSVTHLGDERPIVTDHDIHSVSGIKLVHAGMRINSALYERLLQHKLAPPLDQCLSAENTVTGKSLAEQAALMLKEDKRLSVIQSAQMGGWKLPFVLKQVPLNPAIAFKLTVMREMQAELLQHSLYVALISTYIGMQMRLDKSQLIDLATAALLHDIGMLHVDPELLEREHKMTEGERRHIYVHSVTSWMILKSYPEYTPDVLNAVLQHHERLDGSGYPRGLKSGEIGQLGQIIAVAEIIASRYGNEDVEHGWSRLETILKLNLRRYGWNLVRHLKVFYQEESEVPPCLDMDKQASRDKMSRISAIFSAWDGAWGKCAPGEGACYAYPVCAFINERMANLKMEVADAGLNLYAKDENFLGIEEDSRACFEARILLDETLWQLHNVLQEIRRRWPLIDEESPTHGLNAVNEWMKEVEALLTRPT
jgi:hypothetical protein